MYVYILKSASDHFYIGSTRNLQERLAAHNSGKCSHTSKYKPWKYKNAFWFESEEKAFAFEKYLKSGSGRAFTLKHF